MPKKSKAKSYYIDSHKAGGGTEGRYHVAHDMAWALGVDGYQAFAGRIPSAAGSFADEIYLLTDAPIALVRKYATQGGVTLRGSISFRRRRT